MKDEQKKHVTRHVYKNDSLIVRPNGSIIADFWFTSVNANEIAANQELCFEAFTVFSRTNKTPGELEESIAKLEAALDEIINPIKYMQLRLKEGEQLNGQFAIVNSNSAEYLREIARNAKTPPTA